MSTVTKYKSPSMAPQTPSGQVVVPRASVVMRAFTTTTRHPMLTAAAGLAKQQRLRAEAHQLACDPHADDHVVAAATRAVNAAEAGCAVLIEQIDVWAAIHLTEHRAGLLHTETLGQLIDRLAAGWTRWHLLDAVDDSAARPQARVALRQLGELADAYDDLVTDLLTGRRRLPVHHISTGPMV
ncbi:MAG: DUF4254 domain-containing protein [Actinomycetota bacterium]|nr:DUF4254 domain-containing protein [Actinomycetota bacterium]